MDKIRVCAFWKASKSRYFLKWRDPRTRRIKTKQTDLDKRGKRNDSRAARLAQDWEDELAKRYAGSGAMTWEEFRVMYEDERLVHLSRDSRNKWRAAAAIFDDVWPDHVLGILELHQITPRLLLAVESEMRKRLAAGSVGSYSATLRAGFGWAAKMGVMHMLPRRPPDPVEQVLPAMRLNPISEEQLERMETAVAKIVGMRHAASWTEYLRCLWLSGGRLVDPVWMHPYRRDTHHPHRLEGSEPQFAWANLQKNRTDQIERITPDFRDWLLPRLDREWIVSPTCEHGRITTKAHLSKIVASIGKKARVIAEPGDPPQFATAKHFRSSFVTRLCRQGWPIEVVSRMVRHSSIETTRKYYLAPPESTERVTIRKEKEEV